MKQKIENKIKEIEKMMTEKIDLNVKNHLDSVLQSLKIVLNLVSRD